MNGVDKAKAHDIPKVEISVRNFGPIAEADLDLRPLTVFVGPSNTGKTYLSVLIYALQRLFEGFSSFPKLDIIWLLGYGIGSVSSTDNIELRKELLEVFNKLNRGQPLKFSDLPKMVREPTQSSLNNLKGHSDALETELKRCFDLDSVSELIQLLSRKDNEIKISLKINEPHQNLCDFDIRVSKSEVTVDGGINKEMVISQDPSQPFFGPSKIIAQRYYLPAARSGIMQTHRVIASSLVARSTRTGLETSEISTLSGVVADFMEQLILYKEQAKSDDGMNHIADALESDVLGGQIIMNPSPTGYPEFLYRPQGTEQDMRLTRFSSMVSELAPLVLFIRGLVRPGDTLIIEEPEAHLHPAAQTQMAATLARLVRAGVKVLVTTHSDYMLQEIGNLMRVGMLKEKGALKKETNDWLSPEEVGAWHFQKDQPVKEIQFDHTVGIEPEDYEDVAESLYNRWAGLQNRIEELKDESEREYE